MRLVDYLFIPKKNEQLETANGSVIIDGKEYACTIQQVLIIMGDDK